MRSYPDQSQRTQKNLELEGTKVISSLFILEVDSAGPGIGDRKGL